MSTLARLLVFFVPAFLASVPVNAIAAPDGPEQFQHRADALAWQASRGLFADPQGQNLPNLFSATKLGLIDPTVELSLRAGKILRDSRQSDRGIAEQTYRALRHDSVKQQVHLKREGLPLVQHAQPTTINARPSATAQADDPDAAPVVVGVSYFGPASGDVYGVGEEMYIDVHFSEPLTVTGEPRLAFEMGTETRYTNFNGWNDHDTLWFGYVVQADDKDEDGISVAADAIDLNGAIVQDRHGNDAVLDLGEHARDNYPDMKVDGSIDKAPVVLNFWLHDEPIDNTYAVGEWINGRLAFNKPVTVIGDPKLRIGIGDQVRLADIHGGQDQISLDFEYVVEPDDMDEDGISIAADAIDLNGGSIRDSSGNDLVTDIGDHAFENDARHRVDGSLDRPPFVEWVWVRDPIESPFVAGDRIEVHVNFSDVLVVEGAPRLALVIGTETRYAEYQWLDVTKLGFAYEVIPEDLDEDGLSIPPDAIDTNGGTIRDREGNDALLDLGDHARADDPNLMVDGSLERAGAVARVSFHTGPQNGHTYHAGERVEVGVDFNKDIVLAPPYWMGSLQLALTISNEIRHADIFWHDSRRGIVFAYEITPDDIDDDGITVAADALTLNGTTIQDAGGNGVDLDLGGHAITDDQNHRVDGRVTDTAPVVRHLSISGRPPDGRAYRAGEPIVGNVWFKKNVQVKGDVRLSLTIGDQVRHAKPIYQASCPGNGSYCRTLNFEYIVQADDNDPDGISIAADSLAYHGGWIRDRYGNDAELNLEGFQIENDASRRVDGSVDPPPRIVYISSTTTADNSPVKLNDIFLVWIGFSEPVVVEGTPMLSLDIGGKTRLATYNDLQTFSGTQWEFLGFSYRVATGDADDDGLSFPAAALELVDGSVEDYAGNPALLDVGNAPVFGLPNLRIDTAPDDLGPVVTEVMVNGWRGGNEPVPQGGSLRQNDDLIVSVVFDEYFEADDALTLNIWIGDRPVEIPSRLVAAGFGEHKIEFSYVIKGSDIGDLAITRDALTLAPGASLRDGAGNVAELDLGDHAVNPGSSYTVDGSGEDTAPAIQYVWPQYVLSPYGGSWGEGERLRIIVRFDEPVLVDTTGGAPVVNLQLGTQARSFKFVGHNDLQTHRRDLAFDYYVQSSDFFLTSSDPRLLLNGASIKDASGNDAMLDFPATSSPFWPRVDGEAPPPESPRIESKFFFFSEFSGERGPDRSFGANEFVDIPLYFSEPVKVTGEPTLPFRIGAANRQARYTGGSGTRQLLFRYRTIPSDLGPVELPSTEVELNGGAIAGLDGDNALLDVRSFAWAYSFYYFANGLRLADAENAVAEDVVEMPDTSLRGAVVQALGKIAGTPVTAMEASRLTVLSARDSGISDLTGLELAGNLEVLDLSGNAVSDLSMLADLTNLSRLDLSNNAIRDIEPLLANSGLGRGDTVYLYGNPLSAESIETHIQALRERGVLVYHIDLSIIAASAQEGQSLEFPVRLSSVATDDVEVDWEAAAVVPESATEGEDFPSGERGTLVIRAGDEYGTLSVFHQRR